MTLIELRDVTFHYPERAQAQLVNLFSKGPKRTFSPRGLNSVSMRIEDGDTIGIVGQNGAGKTTLLRVLAGILPPDSGTVSISGEPMALFGVGQGIRPESSGLRNIELRCLIYGLKPSEFRPKIDDIANFSELGEALYKPVNTYSNGMILRLAFSIVTALEPDILIMDEWMGAGDRSFRKRAEARMKEFADRARVLVLASHSGATIRRNCEKALWLRDGNVVDFGKTEDVLGAFEKESDKNFLEEL